MKKVRAPLIWQIIGEKDSGSIYWTLTLKQSPMLQYVIQKKVSNFKRWNTI